MDINQVRSLLQQKLREFDTQKEMADEIGVTPPFLHDVLHEKRAPTGRILEYLGIERVVLYKKKAPRAGNTTGRDTTDAASV